MTELRAGLGRPPQLGRRVLVIGGGDVAYDISLTMLRQSYLGAATAPWRAQMWSNWTRLSY